MDGWHVALDIRSSSTSSSSTGTTKSASPKTSGSDLFAQDLAAAARSSQRALANKAAAAPSKHASTAAKPSPPAKSPSSGKPRPVPDSHSDAKSSSGAGAGKSSATDSSHASGKAQESSAAHAVADEQSGQDGAVPEDAAEANSDGRASANGVSKGRAPARAATKTGAPQSVAANTAGDAIDDPSADTSNQSGMSLLQLLAQSLDGDDSATSPTDSTASATTDKAAANTTNTPSNDPNAIALAMFTQALAAALGTANASPQTTNSSSAAGGDATSGIADATASPNGSASMQDLMSVLAQNAAAGTQGNSDPGASQFNLDATKASAGSDTSTAASAAAGPNSLAHLGIASHFSTQHMRNDTNMSDLKSPVGSAAWDDELGTQLTWMTQKGLETGSLRVSPEHLGPVEVNISVHNGDASVWFGATHPDTRAALEAALPRLREMFASQGMNLTDSGVSRESPRNQARSTASQSISGVSAVGGSDVSTSAAVRMSLGLVDTYA
jgi:flagellar hook-length control protein FliK